MPALAPAADPFHALADERRRDILGLLSEGEQPVNDLVAALGLPQPQVSKHLRVLREAGVVGVRGAGRQRLYSINGDKLRPVHDWVRTFEKFWDHTLARVKERAEHNAEAEARERSRRQMKGA